LFSIFHINNKNKQDKGWIMNIYAKSKLNQNIFDKIRKGAPSIEIHLEEDFVDAKDYWNEDIVRSVPIVAVHAPLLKGNDTDIEVFSNRQILVKTCDFARRIAEMQNHSVMIICHLSTDPKVLQDLGVYENLVFFMRDLANTYECLTFAVENVTPFASDIKGHIAFRSVEYDSSPRFVKDVAHERVGTCLDTCHAMMMIRHVNNTVQYLEYDASKFDNATLKSGMEAFFEANKDTICWMHLANAKTHGLFEDHGRPFDEDDIVQLLEIMRLYAKYDYKCPITIEVREKDYTNAINYVTTRNTLEKVLERLK
jgi:sugar phosphate isomerase/epimerase